MTEDDDDELIRIYRGVSLERPDRALDRKILRAAAKTRIHSPLIPIAAAMAASLILAWIIPWHESRQAVSHHRAARSEIVPGLYDGRVAAELADPTLTNQSIFEQLPGGAEGDVNHGS